MALAAWKKWLQKDEVRGRINDVTDLLTPKWWNWHTRTTQNRMGFARVGSTPTFGTIKKLTPV